MRWKNGNGNGEEEWWSDVRRRLVCSQSLQVYFQASENLSASVASSLSFPSRGFECGVDLL
jgi:hypothetical protein